MKLLNFLSTALIVFIVSCSPLQRAIRKIDRLEYKKEKIYLKYPQLRPDSIELEKTITNPIQPFDTVAKYVDTGSIKYITKILEGKVDTVIIKEVITRFKEAKCIKDTIKKESDLYSIKVFQDSNGIHIQVIPKKDSIKIVTKIKNNTIKDTSKFYDFTEFWFSISMIGLLLIIILYKRKR